MGGYVEIERLKELIQASKITLFTYHSESILSSGALRDSLTYGATIVGLRVGAFKDLHELELIETYTDFNSLVGVVDPLLTSPEENQSRKLRVAEFMEANSWSQFSKNSSETYWTIIKAHSEKEMEVIKKLILHGTMAT